MERKSCFLTYLKKREVARGVAALETGKAHLLWSRAAAEMKNKIRRRSQRGEEGGSRGGEGDSLSIELN